MLDCAVRHLLSRARRLYTSTLYADRPWTNIQRQDISIAVHHKCSAHHLQQADKVYRALAEFYDACKDLCAAHRDLEHRLDAQCTRNKVTTLSCARLLTLGALAEFPPDPSLSLQHSPPAFRAASPRAICIHVFCDSTASLISHTTERYTPGKLPPTPITRNEQRRDTALLAWICRTDQFCRCLMVVGATIRFLFDGRYANDALCKCNYRIRCRQHPWGPAMARRSHIEQLNKWYLNWKTIGPITRLNPLSAILPKSARRASSAT